MVAIATAFASSRNRRAAKNALWGQVQLPGYRYYNPELGRWVRRDPMGERPARNLASFVRNRAICLIDPHGLQAAGEEEECGCSQEEVDAAGYEGSRDASRRTANDGSPPREFCALLCCDGEDVTVEGMHPGKPRHKSVDAECEPHREIRPRYTIDGWRMQPDIVIHYKCSEGSHEVGVVHSHPKNGGFSPSDKQFPCIYVGLPDGRVRRWCPGVPGEPDVEIPAPPDAPEEGAPE